MAMNINNLGAGRSVLDNAKVNENRSNDTTSSGKSSGKPAAAQDSVMITEQAQQLHQVQQSLIGEDTSKSARFEQIKAAVADGSYQVNAERVAQKMGGFESQLDTIYG
ncbi:flagellar biosynthesis anti-sigma factor FlgM [Alginatibacterium sediminis]|uniref:Negative regulator of flagellin synthesis n=1 Tax=Alginatibacterium sediminis TaxID=2164068 RepID=A0A420EG19_9ALTE|nr:flagellar biosynthesis anti-sigma factor FlgM [Alginatibacterium sediminis]RKF19618.1 flagellar biosynthesis anti-sigma factor FlgM [Alginatibacterium sediminis]